MIFNIINFGKHNSIKFDIKCGNKNDYYNYCVSFDSPIGDVSDIGVHSTPENIGIDAIECVAKHLLVLVDSLREKRADDSEEN